MKILKEPAKVAQILTESADQVKDLMTIMYKAEILDHFPENTKQDPFPLHLWMVKKLEKMMISLVFLQFCAPRGLRLSETDPGPVAFPFVLTTADGSRLYGLSMMFYELASKEFVQENNINREKGQW